MTVLPTLTGIFAVASLITVIIHIAKDTYVPVWVPVLFMAIAVCLMVMPK